jgi:hypothetical protein
MLDIPYISAPRNACALACYTMVAKYFFPEVTFKRIATIANWQEGYVVWGFKFWLWIMDRGIKVKNYDDIALLNWANQGVEGLKASVPKKEFEFYLNNTKNLELMTDDIKKVLNHHHFTHHQQNPKLSDLISSLKAGNVCEVVLDAKTLDRKEGFSLHRVVVLDANDHTVTLNDPRPNPMPARKEPTSLFVKAWLEAVNEPELCIYHK